jgi:hypothetical protein
MCDSVTFFNEDASGHYDRPCAQAYATIRVGMLIIGALTDLAFIPQLPGKTVTDP